MNFATQTTIKLFALAATATAIETPTPNDLDGVAQYVAPLTNTTLVDVEVTLEGKVPEWIVGDMINAGPSLFEVGKYTVQNYIDGFMRFNRYRFDGKGKLKMSSKIVDDSKYYKASMKHKEPQQLLFDYPKPRYEGNYVPGLAMKWCGSDQQCDNIGTMAFVFPDQKTYVMTTDQATMLVFNPDDLSTSGFFQFDPKDYQQPNMGATHVVTALDGTGDMIGVLGEMKVGMHMPQNLMTFYRVKASNSKDRIRIGSIPTAGMEYYHSFGHTKDFILMPLNSVTFMLKNMMTGYPVQECFNVNFKNNLKFFLMKIEDGSYETFDVDHPGFIVHTGNSYIDGDNFIIDFEMYIDDTSPFGLFNMTWLKDPERKGLPMGSRFRRYSIDMKTKAVTFKDILSYDMNSAGFPIINPKSQGVKNCFTYLTELAFQEGTTSVLKIDHCKGDQVTRWEEAGVFISEPYFIDDPTSEVEDAGMIMISVYDAKIKLNRMLMIDTQTMKTMSDTTLPIRLPLTLHNQWFPATPTQ